MAEEPCPICDGAGGDWNWACCGRLYPDSRGDPVCCNSPERVLVSECMACGGRGTLAVLTADPLNDRRPQEPRDGE